MRAGVLFYYLLLKSVGQLGFCRIFKVSFFFFNLKIKLMLNGFLLFFSLIL